MVTYRVQYEGGDRYLFIQRITQTHRSNLLLPLPEVKLLVTHLQELLEELDAFGESVSNVASITREWDI